MPFTFKDLKDEKKINHSKSELVVVLTSDSSFLVLKKFSYEDKVHNEIQRTSEARL